MLQQSFRRRCSEALRGSLGCSPSPSTRNPHFVGPLLCSPHSHSDLAHPPPRVRMTKVLLTSKAKLPHDEGRFLQATRRSACPLRLLRIESKNLSFFFTFSLENH